MRPEAAGPSSDPDPGSIRETRETLPLTIKTDFGGRCSCLSLLHARSIPNRPGGARLSASEEWTRRLADRQPSQAKLAPELPSPTNCALLR